MAISTNTVSVGTSSVSLNASGATRIVVKNIGSGIVRVGTTGAPNFVILPGQTADLPLGATDVLFAKSDADVNLVTWYEAH